VCHNSREEKERLDLQLAAGNVEIDEELSKDLFLANSEKLERATTKEANLGDKVQQIGPLLHHF